MWSYIYQQVLDSVDDYGESTVLDAIGSVGGLFALLQAAHVIQFGRPMLWGLTGAKLISPFGLVGRCSSKGFKRRLRQQYYHQDTLDNSEAFRVGAFLRDFVMDLGPAKLNERRTGNSSPMSNQSFGHSEKLIDACIQIPLVPLEVRQTPSFENNIDIDEIFNHARERAENAV
ncbi:hypothetical protein B0J17DRAFT_632222 [Rhizoctonia solani]|nr:hypothetical protein B0J17DRAFT_632222 [Rhizoctonia solani]